MLVTRRVHVCFGNVTRVLHSASGHFAPAKSLPGTGKCVSRP